MPGSKVWIDGDGTVGVEALLTYSRETAIKLMIDHCPCCVWIQCFWQKVFWWLMSLWWRRVQVLFGRRGSPRPAGFYDELSSGWLPWITRAPDFLPFAFQFYLLNTTVFPVLIFFLFSFFLFFLCILNILVCFLDISWIVLCQYN